MHWKKILSSWDKFWVPFPFNRGVVMTGSPIYIKKNDNIEEKSYQLEKALNQVTSQADRLIEKRNVHFL